MREEAGVEGEKKENVFIFFKIDFSWMFLQLIF